MKKLLLLTVLLSAPTMAEDEPFCNMIHDLTTKIMTARQNGVSMPTLVDKINEVGGSEKLTKTLIEITIEAYEFPRNTTKQAQQYTIDEYAQSWYMTCLKGGY